MGEFLHHEQELEKKARKLSKEKIDLTLEKRAPEQVIERRYNKLFRRREKLEGKEYQRELNDLTHALLESVEDTFFPEFEAEILRNQIWINYAFAYYLERERRAERQEKRGDLDHILSSELTDMMIRIYLSRSDTGKEHMERIRRIAEDIGEEANFGRFFTGVKGAVAFGRVIQEKGEKALYVADAKSDVFDKIDLVLTRKGAKRADFRDCDKTPIRDWPDHLKSQIYAVQMKCSTKISEPIIKYLDCEQPLADVNDPEADLTGIEVHTAWKGIGVSGFYVELPAEEIRDEDFYPSENIKININAALERKEISYVSAA